ncbi:MAG: hypothetical protein ACJAVK_001199 [Akkermansiaceae bacterium]|jgi:hypothetical protein
MQKVNEQIHFGFGAYTTYGLESGYSEAFANSAVVEFSTLRSVNLNPAFSYKPGRQWTIGAGFNALYAEGEISSRRPGVGTQLFQLTGDDWGYGYNIGVLYEHTPETRIGHPRHFDDFNPLIDDFLATRGNRNNTFRSPSAPPTNGATPRPSGLEWPTMRVLSRLRFERCAFPMPIAFEPPSERSTISRNRTPSISVAPIFSVPRWTLIGSQVVTKTLFRDRLGALPIFSPSESVADSTLPSFFTDPPAL